MQIRFVVLVHRLGNTMLLLNTLIRAATITERLIQNSCGVRCSFRKIWGYVAVAFNQVDADRLAKVGPNRLCAEWVVKNGGGVRFLGNPSKLWKDYNSLPPETTQFKLKVIDATNASIMKIGLEHFKSCHHIDTVIFHNCKHLEDDGLQGLKHLTNSVTRLQVSGCYNITDSGLDVIGELTCLQQLIIFDMIFVKNMDEVARKLKQSLPGCDIKATKFGVQPKATK